MARSEKTSRRLVVDGTTFLWSVGHHHERNDGGLHDCRETLAVYPPDGRGRLEIVFRAGPGRLVPDGLLHSGAVGTGGAYLNLHEPGTVRALLDEAIAGHGWCADDGVLRRVDGWALFDAVSARRPDAVSARRPDSAEDPERGPTGRPY
ncbi:hypothetical protein ACIOEW_20185 [Streptomyces sp. NPDC087901]|uniref:hypothetical protein n=1 Tax=Streptomyces sp. NPDC087901 TaxID=3365818 RepID=UPI0037FA2C0E